MDRISEEIIIASWHFMLRTDRGAGESAPMDMETNVQ